MSESRVPTVRGAGSRRDGAANEDSVREAIASNRVWYHTIELAPGIETPGQIDLRGCADRVLPPDMSGLRALDIGAFDGFWSFEMEKRGAEVIAIDVNKLDDAEWPPISRDRLKRTTEEWGLELGRGFDIASAALDSNARRVVCNVYELEPPRIGGPVDFAFFGSLLLHLRDPVAALERVWNTLNPSGELRLLEPFSPWLTIRAPRHPAALFRSHDSDFNWWIPNLAGLAAYLAAAGFEDVRRIAWVRPPSTERMKQFFAGYSAVRP